MGFHHSAARNAVDITGDREVRALNILERIGYTRFKGMHARGRDVVLDAWKDGAFHQIEVTPAGTVKPVYLPRSS